MQEGVDMHIGLDMSIAAQPGLVEYIFLAARGADLAGAGQQEQDIGPRVLNPCSRIFISGRISNAG